MVEQFDVSMDLVDGFRPVAAEADRTRIGASGEPANNPTFTK